MVEEKPDDLLPLYASVWVQAVLVTILSKKRMDGYTAPKYNDEVQKIKQYIDAHLSEPLRQDDLCKALYISKSRLNQVFKKYMGITVCEYIQKKRLMMAKDKILKGDFGDKESLMKISLECGFTTYSSFYRAYLKEFGHTPQSDKAVFHS
ncbi:MAG: helix-turn-helix domain-containing protein [Lachnospiraceae bacterium]